MGPPRTRALDRDPAPLLDPAPGLRLLFDVLLGDLPWEGRDGELVLAAGASRATVRAGEVTRSGPRDLWDEAEHVHAAWSDRDCPGPDRMGLRLTRERQYCGRIIPPSRRRTSSPREGIRTTADCGSCGGQGWVWVHYDGKRRKENCPMCTGK